MNQTPIIEPYFPWTKWVATYKPILNPQYNDENESYNGTMFETYGEDLAYVMAHGQKHPNTVWTLLDVGERQMPVVSGYHFVNRFGYFITEVPYNEGDDITVYDDSDIKNVKRRWKRQSKK